MDFEKVEAVPGLPKRPVDSHKGMYGHVLVVGGSRGMAGAAALSGAGALRSGAGLVRVACAAEVQATVASFEPSYMTWPLPCDEQLGQIRFPEARELLESFLREATVVAAGPGLGRSESTTSLVRWLIESAEIPLVLDADGLNALAEDVEVLARRKGPTVLTPHPGEFSRLSGRTTAEVQADREGSAVAFARRFPRTIVVLKGAETVVTDGRRVYLNESGNPGMATGGAGDVLTGVIAAMIGQKLAPFEAAQLGVYAHGVAGDIARDQNGEVGLIAGDIVDALADAFDHLGQDSRD